MLYVVTIKKNSSLLGIKQDDDHGISTQEHFGNETTFVLPFRLVSFARPGILDPHFSNVVKDHIAVTIKGLDVGE